MGDESPHGGARGESVPRANGRYVLAWAPAAEHVDRVHVIPIDGSDVTQIRCVGPVVSEDTGDVLVRPDPVRDRERVTMNLGQTRGAATSPASH